MVDERFKRVYDYLLNEFRPELQKDITEEYKSGFEKELNNKFENQFNILKNKLVAQTYDKYTTNSLKRKEKAWLGYNKTYLITHFWIVFEKIFFEIKWAWQRVFRGWDDRVVWSIDDYLAEMLPQWLSKLKDTKHGVPLSVIPEKYFDEDLKPSDEGVAIGQQNYDEILNKIIKGFENYGNWLLENNIEKSNQMKHEFDETFHLFMDYFDTLWD